MKLPKYLVTAEEMRAFDATAIKNYGIPGVVLMENAGRATFQIIQEQFSGDVGGLRASVVAGPGNNGGDGYVIARYLINHGAHVKTFLLAPRDKIKGDALINLEILDKMSGEVSHVPDEESFKRAVQVWRESDLIVDAMLGTGLRSEVRSPYREAITEINRTRSVTVAVDLPSGLDADTGRVLGVAVEADITATYGFRKLGMALYPGIKHCGKIGVVDISIPLPAIQSTPPLAVLMEEAAAETFKRVRSDPQAHKGTFGHLLIVGGSVGKTGAPAMAARAASRIGAGLVTVGIPESLNAVLEVKLTEEMTAPLPENPPGFLSEGAAEQIVSLAEGKRCIVVGPGFGRPPGAPSLIKRLLAVFNGWIVIDADGLNCLAPNLDALHETMARVVLTPHPGEMGTLMRTSCREVQQDRITAARTLAANFGIWVVLKGSRTLTVSPEGKLFVNTRGTQWMASGGQGDVLSGILGGLLVQSIPPEEAIPLGVYLHGLAADNVVKRVGPAAVLATDVIDELQGVVAGVMCGEKRESQRGIGV